MIKIVSPHLDIISYWSNLFLANFITQQINLIATTQSDRQTTEEKKRKNRKKNTVISITLRAC